jgi:uncharacterized protein (TIGR02271 family)
MSKDENEYTRLEELGGSKYEIVDGEPNIKGWEVKNENGVDIGEVDELLFDPESLKVRYLVIDLDPAISGVADRRVLVPIGLADLKVNNEMVLLPNVNSAQLSELPEYENGHLTYEIEREIRSVFEAPASVGTATGAEADTRHSPVTAASATISPDERQDKKAFYTHQHFDEDKFYSQNTLPVIEENLEIGKKRVETGRTSISSRIVERKVEGTVDLKEEHVRIERTPVNRPLTSADGEAFKEQNFEIIEHAEVPVVSKEARVVEEITIHKEVEERQETIHETLRNTEVKAEHIDPGQPDSSDRI